MIAIQHLKHPAKYKVRSFVTTIVCLIVLSTSLMASQTVERFGFFEASFQAADTYKNPYTDLQASAVIQRPDGTKRTLALFWDGADSWKIRISPDLEGKWRFKVRSADDGLDGQTGEFTSVPSKRKGSIRPMPGFARHFSRQDGTPFLFWGDTGWALYQDEVSEKLNRKAVFHYIHERAGQGVNVIHSMLLQEAGWGNRGGDPFESMAEETLNPAYWKEVDLRLQYLNDKGIIGGLVLAWGDKRRKEPYAWRRFPGFEARKRYARYIAARYGAYDVYFIVSGEWHAEIRTRANVTEQKIRAEFIEIGDALHEADVHNRMIGIHPMTQRGSVREFNKASWMSFGDYQQNYRMLHERILESRSASSGQARPHPGPIVNSEYGYFLRDSNFDGVVDKNNSFSPDAMRHATWDIIMAGGYPVTGYGTTYMGGNRDKGPFNVDDPRNDVWERQYHVAQHFLRDLEWWKLQPHDDWISSSTPRSSDRQVRLGPPQGPKRTLLRPPETTYWLLAEQSEHYVAYVRGVTDKVTIKFGPDAVDLRMARLLDPRTGEKKIIDKKTPLKDRFEWLPPDSRDWVLHLARTAELDSGRYLKAVQDFADVVIEKGRDTYGNNHTPLFADGLHAGSLKPVIWKKDGQSWVLSNFASQQPLIRILDGLSTLTTDSKYRRAATDATDYALQHLQSDNGLLYWGGHLAWDLQTDRPVGQYAGAHEMKGHQPYYSFMWKVDPESTRKLMGAIWATHILDWSRLDYNRHANTEKPAEPKWNHEFAEAIEVPFPTDGGNLSFANVTPPLMHSGTMLAALDKNDHALIWTRRLVSRWQQGKHPETGLCGGQLSYRKHDRAQDALGHVHPSINEAKIVASYHQTSRYHHIPLAQMQAGQTLLEAGGKYADAGREFIAWALDDLKIYARRCWNPDTRRFVALMTDGTPLKWQEAKEGYYVPESFAPRNPDGHLLWSYATAYRLSEDDVHWRMARQMGRSLGIGDIGLPNGEQQALNLRTDSADWRLIYALLELHLAAGNRSMLKMACIVADNLLKLQTATGLFPRPQREYARTGDEIPLALLHLAAALEGRSGKMPRPTFDSRFFHCEYHGQLAEHQKKRADKRTYDNYVFYGSP